MRVLERHRGRGLWVLAVLFMSTPRAHAQAPDAAAAQALFDQGKALMTAGKAVEACPKFAESQRLDPGVGTLLNLAACYEAAGRLASAWSTFLEAESAARLAGSAEGLEVSRDRASALAPRLSKILLTVAANAPLDLEIQRDGVLVGRAQWGLAIPADPGQHTIVAHAPGRTPWQRDIDLTEPGATIEVAIPELALAPPPPPPAAAAPAPAPPPEPPSKDGKESSALGTQHYVALGVGGLGVVGVVVGSIFGLQSMAKGDEAALHCDGGDCRDMEGVTLLDDARSAGNVSTIAFIVGGVGLAGGALLWFTADDDTAAIGLAPDRVMLRGRF